MNSLLPKTGTISRIVALMAVVLIVKVVVSILSNYPDYFPPNFQSLFLTGRERYFYGAYQAAFYTHLVAGPFALLAGTVLISERFRQRFPVVHRWLGRVQCVCVLLLLTPSSLWMAWYAATGTLAGLGFASLSLVTATCVAMGWRTAVQRRFVAHRRWMWRSFLLLCSAVVLRLTAGVAIVTNIESEWVYPLSAWSSWLVPLVLFECIERAKTWAKSRRFSAAVTPAVINAI